jgi:superfamily II DNA or RNA helicase
MGNLRGLVVRHLERGGLHLVTGSSLSVMGGETYYLMPLGKGPQVDKATENEIEIHQDPSFNGSGTIFRMMLANRRAEESGGGGLSLRCSTDFKAFQFRPLLKYRGEAEKRLLIADETGLGKTIEVGYILAEEFAAGHANRVLILTPKSVLNKWRKVMRRMFGINLQKMEGSKRLIEKINNPEETFHLIATHDVGKKTPGWWKKLTGGLDMLVIDEIHRHIGRVDGGKFRRPMAKALSEFSEGTIGLTATPVQIERTDLNRILDVINPGMFDEVDFNQELKLLSLSNVLCGAIDRQNMNEIHETWKNLENMIGDKIEDVIPEKLLHKGEISKPEVRLKAKKAIRELTITARHMTRARAIDPDVDEFTPRVVHPTVWVDMEEDERRIFNEVDEMFKHFFSHSHRQQLVSSLPPMEDLLWKGSEGERSWNYKENAEFEFESDDKPDSDNEQNELTNQRCQKLAEEFEHLGRTDTKLSELMKILNNLPEEVEKVVLFTHWRPTFRHLNQRLKATMGEMGMRLFSAKPNYTDVEDLEKVADDFEKHEGRALLLCTDRLSEGVDLDAANCVINYDLPYNPQSLQQRIGRVDRVTQKAEKIHVFNIAVRDSIDEHIMKRLIERTGFFMQMVGDMQAITEEMVGRTCRDAEIHFSDDDVTVQQLMDRENLMDGDMTFQLVDQIFDDLIKEARNDSQPLHNRDHEIFIRLFKVIAPDSDSEWNDEDSIFKVEVPKELAKRLISMLSEHELGRSVAAQLEKAQDSGELILRFKGKHAHLGPLNRLQTWATEVMMAIEGMYDETVEHIPSIRANVELGGVKLPVISSHRWHVLPVNLELSLNDFISRLEAKKYTANLGERSSADAPSQALMGWSEQQARLDHAERNRIHRARLARLHAILNRITDSDDASEEQIESIKNEISNLNNSIPKLLSAEVIHHYQTKS